MLSLKGHQAEQWRVYGKVLGFARVVTLQGWLSTWSGLSSNAEIAKTGPGMTEPAVVINAGRDLDVYPNTHSRLIFDTIRSVDKQY